MADTANLQQPVGADQHRYLRLHACCLQQQFHEPSPACPAGDPGALYFLRVAGILPYNIVTEYAVQVGSGIEFLLLSLGLAWKINQFKNEKLAAERATVELQRSLNQRLEDQVLQRTQELERANRQLTILARTDPLTGLLNRRQFHELVDQEMQRRRRSGQTCCSR
nr:GGDEF domain-containing protein [Halomonas sp. MCCC 1A13316]